MIVLLEKQVHLQNEVGAGSKEQVLASYASGGWALIGSKLHEADRAVGVSLTGCHSQRG